MKTRPSGDKRPLKKYVADIIATEESGLHPEYSAARQMIIQYWRRAVKKGLVGPDDSMAEAIQKMKRHSEQPKRASKASAAVR